MQVETLPTKRVTQNKTLEILFLTSLLIHLKSEISARQNYPLAWTECSSVAKEGDHSGGNYGT